MISRSRKSNNLRTGIDAGVPLLAIVFTDYSSYRLANFFWRACVPRTQHFVTTIVWVEAGAATHETWRRAGSLWLRPGFRSLLVRPQDPVKNVGDVTVVLHFECNPASTGRGGPDKPIIATVRQLHED